MSQTERPLHQPPLYHHPVHQPARPFPEGEWRTDTAPVAYEDAMAAMEERAAAVALGTAPELVWLLEHPPVYTAGTSARDDEVLDPRFPVIRTGRGGRHTYHGPGQRVGYLVLNLSRRGRDVRCFVHALEGWLAAALARLGVDAWAVPGRVGLWTRAHGREAKVGAIGVRVRRWVTMHGFSLNVRPDLSHFGGIVPCGLADYPVTSLADIGAADIHGNLWEGAETLDAALAFTFPAFLDSLACRAKMET